jgi:glycerol-3-phosphate dehydrogenase
MTDFLLGAAVVVFGLALGQSVRIVLGKLQEARTMASEALEAVSVGKGTLNGSQAVLDLSGRLATLERKVAEIDLSVLDTAEKVAHRLSDRDRKRAAKAAPADEELDDEAAWWARARSAHPLPGVPAADQLPLLAMPEDDQ